VFSDSPMCRVNTSRTQARQIDLSSFLTASLGKEERSTRFVPATDAF